MPQRIRGGTVDSVQYHTRRGPDGVIDTTETQIASPSSSRMGRAVDDGIMEAAL
jgi:hypothetical protein